MIPAHVIDAFYRGYHHRLLPHISNITADDHRQAVDAGLRAAIPAYLHHQADRMRAESHHHLALVVSHSLDGHAAELEPSCPAHEAPSPRLPSDSPPTTCSASAPGIATTG